MRAILSPCGRYRYTLHREIEPSERKPCLFIMLNPSTADAVQNDPTIRRCLAFARREDCTSLTVVNLYALRSTNPAALATAPDPVGPENDLHIQQQVAAHHGGLIIAAWGSNAFAIPRALQVLPLLGKSAYCLGRTVKLGMPRHPLYVGGDQVLVRLS
jgi:hypothetical protein